MCVSTVRSGYRLQASQGQDAMNVVYYIERDLAQFQTAKRASHTCKPLSSQPWFSALTVCVSCCVCVRASMCVCVCVCERAVLDPLAQPQAVHSCPYIFHFMKGAITFSSPPWKKNEQGACNNSSQMITQATKIQTPSFPPQHCWIMEFSLVRSCRVGNAWQTSLTVKLTKEKFYFLKRNVLFQNLRMNSQFNLK